MRQREPGIRHIQHTFKVGRTIKGRGIHTVPQNPGMEDHWQTQFRHFPVRFQSVRRMTKTAQHFEGADPCIFCIDDLFDRIRFRGVDPVNRIEMFQSGTEIQYVRNAVLPAGSGRLPFLRIGRWLTEDQAAADPCLSSFCLKFRGSVLPAIRHQVNVAVIDETHSKTLLSPDCLFVINRNGNIFPPVRGSCPDRCRCPDAGCGRQRRADQP